MPFDGISLTALSCGRTFADSAVRIAPGIANYPLSPTGGPRGEPERRICAFDRRLNRKGVLSMFHCRVNRAGLTVRATDFHHFFPSGSSP